MNRLVMNHWVSAIPALANSGLLFDRAFMPLRALMLAMLLVAGAGLTATDTLADALPEDVVININLAPAEELSTALSGVGLAKAKRIVEYREMYGPFEHVDELAEVRGIGISTVDKNRTRIVLH